MSVFKNNLGTYEIDFSEGVVERLEELWTTDKAKFEQLEEHLYDKFDWIAGLNISAPALYDGFKKIEIASKCDIELHREINKWYRENSY